MAFTPEDFATLQDPEFHKFVAEQMGFPQKQKETGGFWAGVKTAGGSQLQGVGQLAADFGWENNPIEAYGKQVQENNQLRTQSLGDIVENPWQALKEGTGMAVGYLAPGLVGRGLQLAGGAAKLAGLSRAGNALNAGVTQGALAALPSYGGIREEQGDTDSWTDKAVAGLGAAAVGAIENQFGAQRLLGIGRGAKAAAVPTKAEFVAKLGATPLKSGLKEFGRVVGAEMGEELAQNPIEQVSAYQNPLTPENIHESLFGAAMAGLGTLGLGGAGGARMGMRHAGLERQMASDLLNPAQVPLGDLRETAEWKQAFMNKAGENGNDWYDELMRDQFALRNQQTKDATFNQALDTMHGDVDRSILALPAPVREMPSTMPELDAQAENERGVTDAVRRNEELWAQREAEARQRPGLDGFTRLPAPGQSSYVMPAEGSTAQVDLMRLGELGARTDATARAENANALLADAQSNRPATDGWNFNTQRISLPQDLGSAIGVLNQAVEMRRANQPIVSGSEMHSALLAADSIVRQSGYDPKQIIRHYEGTPSATQTQPVAAQAAATTQQKAQPKPAAAPAAKVTQPRGKFSQAFQAKLEAAVAEGKVASDDPIVADWHASKKLKADAQSFGQALDDKLAGPTVLPMTAEQALQTKAKNAVAEVKAGGLNLTMKQIPVFEHLQKAFAENRVDDVIGADGKWKYNEIGTALGLARGSVESFVNGVAKRIAEAQGVSVDEMKAALKARTAEVRTTEMSEKDKLGLSPKQQSSVFNEEDLFGNENGAEQNAEVINTVGGSQSAVGTNEAPTDLVVNRPDAPEVVANKLQSTNETTVLTAMVEEARSAGGKRVEEAQSTWNEYAESSKPTGVPFNSIPLKRQLAWLQEYNDLIDEFGDLPWAQLEPRITELYHEYSNDLGSTDGKEQTAINGGGVGSATQIGNTRTESQVARLAGPRQETAVENRAVPEGQPVSDEAAGRSDTEGQAGEVSEKAKLQDDTGAEGKARRSESRGEGTGQEYSKAGSVRDALKRLFFSPARFDNFVRIFQTEAEAAAHPELRGVDTTFAGLAYNGRVYLIADNIEQGGELGVFLHELGVHIGMEKLIGRGNIDALAKQISKWSEGNGTSVENRLARIALHRLENAMDAREDRGEEPMSAEEAREELLAYFTEEAVLAGINPQAVNATPIGRFFRTLVAAMKVALRKIGLGRVDQLTAQNFVDLAFGAADMEMAGTWHGTAADFRNFNHDYMGSGEGAQAFGWGTYLAQRTGIAKGYWKDDVRRKRGVLLGGVDVSRMTPAIAAEQLHERLGMSRTAIQQAILQLKDVQFNIREAISDVETGNVLSPRIVSQHKDDILAVLRIAESFSPDGAMMRVRPLVTDEELLDWDKPLSEQNRARVALTTLRKTLGFSVSDLTDTKWNDLTGHDLIGTDTSPGLIPRALEGDYITDVDAKTEQAIRRGEFYKAASLYLDSIGIKGIKFLDSQSRNTTKGGRAGGVTYKGKYYSHDTLKQKQRESRDNEGEFDLWSLLRSVSAEASVSEAETKLNADFERNPSFHQSKYDLFQKIKGDIVAGEYKPQTRNLVVFNDKNVSRVTSQVGARRDSESIKFSEKLKFPQRTNESDADYKERMDRIRARLAEVTYVDRPVDKAQADVKSLRKLGTPTRRSDKRNVAATERIQEVAGPTAARLSTDASTIIGRAAKWFISLHDLIGKYGNMLPSANDWYKSVRATIATRTQLEGDAESIAARAGKLKPEVLKTLNKFVADSTFEQKWGFNATFDKIDGTKRSVTADPEMARRFNALPEDARQIAKDMFLHAEAVKLTKFKLLKELGLSGLFDTQGSLAGPYAPLKRFGNYVAVLKSKELLAAEEAGDKKRVEELKRDYKHYVVSYFDTKGLAKEFAQKEQSKDGWAYAQHFPKAQHIKETSETSQSTLQKVLAAMKVEKDKLPPGAYAMIEEVILDMHMRKFDEDNARMNGLKRKNRYGYDEDMVRAFLSHARAEAGFLANLKHGGTTNELFYKMQFEAGKAKDRDAAMEVFNAISNHYAANIDQRETPIQDRITALTSVMQLATNPAYHLQNLTQPFITSVPRLAADFGDYAGAWKALMEGYRVVRSVGTKNIDLSKVQNLKLRAALQGASDAGLLDVGMDEDLINFEATRTGYAALDMASKGAKKVIHMLRQVSRRVEGANRISAAVAAFNMAQASGKFKDDAAINDYVISVLQDTQGDFSRTDAPLIIKKLPKPLVQYRKFQLMMAAHYVKAFNDAFRSESPEARAVGRRALAYSLGHAFATAGALGIPLMNIVGLIFAHTGDDDEPRDLERSLREWIGDEDMAKLLLHGPLWWMGMDAKLAQDKVFSFLPYADWDLTSKEGLKNLGVGLAGPAGSQALKMAGGLEYLSKGDTIKGFEGLLPSGISNGLKAFRVANEGFTLKNGDLMMSPEEINGAALMLDAVGLKSPTMRDLEWTRNQQYEIKEFYQTKTKEIQRAYADAYKDGDTEAMTEAREEWMALQEGKDRLRAVFNNSPDELKRQPLSTLLKYPRTQDKREQKLQKSVPE